MPQLLWVRIILCIGVSILITGCYQAPTLPAKPVTSQVPIPNAYPLSTQQKMQAAHHWGILATDVAGRVCAHLKEAFPETPPPIYVAPAGITPFDKAFYELLITRLVNRGIPVHKTSSCPLVLSFDTQLIFHKHRNIRTRSGVYRSLAPGFYVKRDVPLYGPNTRVCEAEFMVHSAEVNVEAGKYTIELPRTEIIVNVSILSDSTYIMRHTSVYYINDPEKWHYAEHNEFSEKMVKTYTIVDR